MQKEHLSLKILFAMLKFSGIHIILVILTFGMSMAKEGLAQEMLARPVYFEIHNKDIRTTLFLIEKSAKVKFSYEPTVIPKNEMATLVAKGDPLSKVLDRLLSPLDLKYDVSGKYIILTRNNKASERSFEPVIENGLSPLDIKVSGKVTDEKGVVLPGVSIVVKGKQLGTTTDAEGHFTMSIPDAKAVLIFSFVGFHKQEIPVGSRTSFEIALVIDTKSLDELVVVGYGAVQRKDVTGSIASIASKELDNLILNTPEQALQGRAPGVNVRTSSHAPGGAISVNIRGTSSLTANGQPLYVIDGFPVSSDFKRPNNAIEGGDAEWNPLASIDATNIASIEILKDASATAIYGSRGTNGVVIITTKRGRTGKPKVEFQTSVGVRQISKKYDFLNGSEYAALLNERALLNNQAALFNDAEIADIGEGTDWSKELFRSALNQRYRVSISGGTPEVRYLISGNYDDQQGIVLGTGFKKYSANINLDADVSKRFKIGTSINLTNSQEQMVRNDTKASGNWPSMIQSFLMAPIHIPARNEMGEPTFFNTYKGGSSEENPLFMAEKYDVNANTIRLLSSVFGSYEILEGLSLKTRLGVDYRDWRFKSYYPIASKSASATSGQAIQYSDRTVNLLNENTLEYNRSFGTKHKLNAVIGFTNQVENSEFLKGEAFGFADDFYSYNNLGVATNPQAQGSGKSQWKLLSYLGRVNYNLSDKYLLTVSGRIDGSSKFGKNNKYGFFPSAAFAWRLSEENLFKSMKNLSDLKLRLGYGNTGNERIGLYNSIGTIGTGRSATDGYVFNGQLVTVAYPSNIPNPDLTWEKARDLNVGLDVGLWNDRFTLSIDAYHKKTTDLLMAVPLPTESGFGSILRNQGSMENKGIELGIKTVNFTGAFNWSTNLNFSLNRNKVLDLGGAPYLFTGWVGGNLHQNNGTNVVRLAPGKPVGAFYGSVADGVWKSKEEITAVGTMRSAVPGSMRYKDTDNNGTYNALDDTYIGNPNPDFTIGITNNFEYKRWTLNIFMFGEFGQEVIWLTKKRFAGGIAPLASDRNNRWTPGNPDRPNATLAVNQVYPSALSTDNTYNASYLRISNITLSYLIPVKTTAIQGLKVSLSTDNAFVFTKYPGFDPDVNSYGTSNVVKGMDRYSYPASKMFRLGLNASF
jgi:TonB-linked SusC/RagA family outer membrane protein